MKYVKFILLVTILYLLFYLIKPIDDEYSYLVGNTIGTISMLYVNTYDRSDKK